MSKPPLEAVVLGMDEKNGSILYRQPDATGTKTVLIKSCTDPSVANLNTLKHEYHVLSSIRRIKKDRTNQQSKYISYTDGCDHIINVISLSADPSLFDSQDSLITSSEEMPQRQNNKPNLYLILEDLGGISMKSAFLDESLTSSQNLNKLLNIPLGVFISIAFQLSLALDTIHESSLLHRGLSPKDIYIVPRPGYNNTTEYFVQIIDFSSAIYLEGGSVIAGSYQNTKDLRYISPEQTGRMNRMVDYRSDFYSLGTILYQLLTGHLPLEGSDTMSLIHALIARRPIPANIRNQTIPICIGSIITKLLEKAPQNRYQSARGLRNDLVEILSVIKAQVGRIQHPIMSMLSPTETVDFSDIPILCSLEDDEIMQMLKLYKAFVPGKRDPPFKTLLISEKMYGRQAEIQTMRDAFFYSVQKEKTSFLVVKGQGGSGKTRIITELQPLVVEYRGLWAYSKFDLTNQDTGYYSLFSGTRKLYHDLINSSEASLNRIRDYLRANMDPYGVHLMKSYSPDLILFYGPLPPVSQNWHVTLSPQQIQQLQASSWETFIRGLLLAGPLVIVLDDMQWADIATTNFLVESVRILPELPILYVLTYRDQDIGPDNQMFELLNIARSMNRPVFEIELNNLKDNDVSAMLGDTLHVKRDEVVELAKYIVSVTNGNPFHIHAFLKEMYYRNILNMQINEDGEQTWTWSMDAILSANMGTSVIELMAQQIKTRLPSEAREILKYAACIGHTFDLQTLAKLVEDSVTNVAKHLWPAIEQGYIVTQGDHHRYLIQSQQSNNPEMQITGITTPIIDKFVHDRVQNAAYDMIPESMRPRLHLKIARVKYSYSKAEDLNSKLFLILHHYEKGLHEALEELNHHEQSDAYQFAELAYQAALCAKKTSSFALAARYVRIALKILTFGKTVDEAWTSHYDLMLRIVQVKTFVSAGLGDIPTTAKYYESIRKHGKSVSDKLSSAITEYSGYLATFQYEKSLKQLVSDLQMLGINVPKTPNELEIDTEKQLEGKSTFEILKDYEGIPNANWPEINSDNFTLEIQFGLLTHLMTTSFITQQIPLCIWASSVYIHTLFKHQRFHHGIPESLLYFGTRVSIYDTENRKRIYKIWDELIRRYQVSNPGMKSASNFLCVILCWNTMTKHETDETLGDCISKALESGNVSLLTYACFTHMFFKFEWSTPMTDLIRWTMRFKHKFEAMSGASTAVWFSTIKHYHALMDDRELSPMEPFVAPRLTADPSVIGMLTIPRIVTALIFSDYQVLAEIREREDRFPIVQWCRYVWAWSLLAADNEELSVEERLKDIDKLLLVQEALVRLNEEMEAHELYFMYAEKARLMGNEKEMLINYEKTIENCRKHGWTIHEALANERMAKYWIKKDPSYKRIASFLLMESARLYSRWGVMLKVRQMERDYPEYFQESQRWRRNNVRARDDRSNCQSVDELSQTQSSEVSRKVSLVDGRVMSPRKVGTLRTLSLSASSSVIRSRTAEDVILPPQTASKGHVDVTTLLKATQMIANEANLENILRALVYHTAINIGATEAQLALKDQEGQFIVQASYDGYVVKAMQALPLYTNNNGDLSPLLPLTILENVSSTGRPVIVEDALNDPGYKYDLYVSTKLPKSILCVPIIQKKAVIGILYLENNLTAGAFTEERLEIVTSLTAAASISIENSRLQQVNTELRVQLSSQVSPREETPKYIVDGPIKSALDSINEIMRLYPTLSERLRLVEDVLILGQNAFASNLDAIQDESGRGIDSDTKDWLKVTIQLDDTPSLDNSLTAPGQSTLRNRRGRRSTFSVSTSADSQSDFSNIQEHRSDEVKEILSLYNSPSFNIFDLEKATSGAPLALLGPYIINESLGIGTKLGLNPKRVEGYFRSLESTYRNVPYHNSSHAADVMQTTLMLISSNPSVYSNFSSLEIFAAILSGAAHDADHPGFNNNFLIQTKDRLAVLYSDQSVLEYHHSSTAFTVALSQEEDNIFKDLPQDKFRDLRKIIVHMILATDMARHFEYINKFKARLAMKTQAIGPSGSTIMNTGAQNGHPIIMSQVIKDFDDPLDRQLILEIAIKCADLSNPAKSPDIAVRWTDAIMKEFFNQGDMESARGLSVSRFMDRTDPNVPKCQIGFIDVLVSPLFEAWRLGIGENPYILECTQNIAANRKFWDNLLQNQRLTPEDALLAVKVSGEPTSAKIIDEQEDAYPQDNKKSKRFAI